MSNNNKRPGIFSETQRIKIIGAKMRELAFLLNSDESFVGKFPISDIAGPDNRVPTRLVAVQSPKKFYQLDATGDSVA